MPVKIISSETTTTTEKVISIDGITNKTFHIIYVNGKATAVYLGNSSTSNPNKILLIAGEQTEEILMLMQEYTRNKDNGNI